MNYLKKRNGITLVALVITIVVMLILAGVSISYVVGNNNILATTTDTVDAMSLTQVEQQVDVALINCETEYYTATYMAESTLGFSNWLTTARLNRELNDAGFMLCKDGETKDTLSSATELVLENQYIYVTSLVDETDIYEIKLDVNENQEFEIASVDIASNDVDDKGEIDEDEDLSLADENVKGNVTASDILDEENKIKFYGATVNGYECEYSDAVKDWKVFYSDGEHVYLIASDYISYKDCPDAKGGSKIVSNKTDYEVSFDNVINDYDGSSDIKSNIKKLNNSFFSNGYESTSINMKAISYILDTDVWSVYKGEKADYAIGSPTVELLFDSYNDKYKTDYKYKAINNDGNLGYVISSFGVTYEDFLYEILDPSDSLYTISDKDKAEAMWLASPSTKDTSSLMRATYWGSVGDAAFNYSYPGLRPVVCLLSDTELIEESDGTYTIK